MDDSSTKNDYTLPLPTAPVKATPNAAADVVRQKLASLYQKEPDAGEEALRSFETPTRIRSKHEVYMVDISNSGKSLAEIQTLWHDYYQSLSDAEKHEVWQEFYEQHARSSEFALHTAVANTNQNDMPTTQTVDQPTHIARNLEPEMYPNSVNGDPRSVSDIKQQLLAKVTAKGRLKAKHHLQSVLFGLGMGSIVVLIFMFGFFNERILAPFITPSKTVSLPAIIDPNQDNNVSPDPLVYIPSINAVVPVVYTQTTNEEKAVQKSLEDGVVRLAGTANPGEKGNVVIVGHSSNNILNQGKFKFAFVNLRKVQEGELFYLHKDGKRYTYKVISKKVVAPTDVSVLASTDTSIATLITCDPPGTSLKRLVIVGQQIRPDPTANNAPTDQKSAPPATLPSNAPSLWQRIFN